MKIKIYPELSVYAVTLPEKVTEKIVLEGFRDAFSNPLNQPSFNGVIDLRPTHEFDLSQNTLVTLAYLISSNRTPSYRAAHIVETPLQVGTSNMCMSFTEMQSVEETRQFKNVNEAFLWVAGFEKAQDVLEKSGMKDFDELLRG